MDEYEERRLTRRQSMRQLRVILFDPSLYVCFVILSFRALLLRSLLEDLPPPILLYFSFMVLVEFRSESAIDSVDGDLNMVSVVEPGND